MLKKISLCGIILAVLIFNAFRFWKLDTIPHGFHVDEMGSAVTMQCMNEKGCDAELTYWPLFAEMEYGQDKPPAYVYPGILWVKGFGSTVPVLRAYSVFVFLIGILGLFFLSKQLFGKSFAAVVVLAASCSPWAWVVTRVAFESYFAPVFAIWGFYFFWRSNFWWDWALAAFLFVCAMYTYPPARLQIPLMLCTLMFYEWGRRTINWRSVLSFFMVFFLSLLPLVRRYMYDTNLSRRFSEISIFNKDYVHHLGITGTPWDFIQIFFHNYCLHLSPSFLFITGDPSYVHSTRHMGILSVFDIAALIILIIFAGLAIVRRCWSENPVIKNRRLLTFLAANFFIGIIPSALTNQELPHALRICGSWPFMMLLTGLMWWTAAEALRFLWPLLALTGILFGGVLAYQYFTIYPQESKGMFDFWIKDVADQCKSQSDWQKFIMANRRRNYHCRYYMVHGLGMTCKQANDFWWAIFHYLEPRGLF